MIYILAALVLLILSEIRSEMRLRAFATERESLLAQGLEAREKLEERFLDAEREWHAQRSELLSRIQTPELAIQRLSSETDPEFVTEEQEEFEKLIAEAQ